MDFTTWLWVALLGAVLLGGFAFWVWRPDTARRAFGVIVGLALFLLGGWIASIIAAWRRRDDTPTKPPEGQGNGSGGKPLQTEPYKPTHASDTIDNELQNDLAEPPHDIQAELKDLAADLQEDGDRD